MRADVYGGADPRGRGGMPLWRPWVHQAATRLSEGGLHRLAHWLTEAERDLNTFRWYAGEPTDVSPESHRFAIEFSNALMDKDVPKPSRPE